MATGTTKQAWYQRNKDRVNAESRARYAANPELRKIQMLWNSRKQKYGIIEEQYHELLRSQDGRCAICRTDDPGKGKDPLIGWPIDHNHETGEVRGLVCSACNTALGLFKDDPLRLYAAILYLGGDILELGESQLSDN